MDDDESYTSKISFTNVKANKIFVAGRDMFIGGWDEGHGRFEAVRDALTSANIPSQKRNQALKELGASEEEAREELNKGESDLTTLSQRIETLTGILRDSGALVSSGTALGKSLKQLASWLGPAGESILGLLS
jgi:chromosome segregation ATPase